MHTCPLSCWDYVIGRTARTSESALLADLTFEPPAYMKDMMDKMAAQKESLSPYTCKRRGQHWVCICVGYWKACMQGHNGSTKAIWVCICVGYWKACMQGHNGSTSDLGLHLCWVLEGLHAGAQWLYKSNPGLACNTGQCL